MHVATALPITPCPDAADTGQGYPEGQWTVTSEKMQWLTEDSDDDQGLEEERPTCTGAAARPSNPAMMNTSTYTPHDIPASPCRGGMRRTRGEESARSTG